MVLFSAAKLVLIASESGLTILSNGRDISDHFVQSYKMITKGKVAKQQVEDTLLSRYTAYLIVMNGDPRMPVVAMGQEYFAEQTRRQEISASVICC